MLKGKNQPSIDPSDIERLALRYFAECEENKEPITLTGLALSMGFSSRQAFLAYARKAPESPNTNLAQEAQRALLRVEAEYEKALRGGSATGSIFALKSLGWSEKPEAEVASAPPKTVIVKWEGEEVEKTATAQLISAKRSPTKKLPAAKKVPLEKSKK